MASIPGFELMIGEVDDRTACFSSQALRHLPHRMHLFGVPDNEEVVVFNACLVSPSGARFDVVEIGVVLQLAVAFAGGR